jgi:hypothetical protein
MCYIVTDTNFIVMLSTAMLIVIIISVIIPNIIMLNIVRPNVTTVKVSVLIVIITNGFILGLIMQNDIMLIVIVIDGDCNYTEWHYAKHNHAECHLDEICCAECQ